MYREKIVYNGQSIRCRVYVMSVASVGRNNLGQADVNNIVVSFRPNAPIDSMAAQDTFTWLGKQYTVQNAPVPMVALGGVDHLEVHAKRVTG